jgi:hypothetical protein
VKVGDSVQQALNSFFGFLPRSEPVEGIDGLHGTNDGIRR